MIGHGDSAEAAPVATAEDASKQRSGTESFLDAAILKQLQRQLDHEAVESEMNVKVCVNFTGVKRDRR